MKKIVKIEGMTCGHCVASVEKALKSIEGIERVKVDLKKKQAEISSPEIDDQKIVSAVTEAGYSVVNILEDKGGFSLFKIGMIFIIE